MPTTTSASSRLRDRSTNSAASAIGQPVPQASTRNTFHRMVVTCIARSSV
ncbi:MAG: hypothetical protein IPJ34_09485 [Myxococcales bacterium]|nr:hypothetical protein [Myxococcales bacterium]